MVNLEGCCKRILLHQGRIQDLIRGGPQIVTGLKLPFWGLSFVEFWCWGLIFGGWGAPWIRPCALLQCFYTCTVLLWSSIRFHCIIHLEHGPVLVRPPSLNTSDLLRYFTGKLEQATLICQKSR